MLTTIRQRLRWAWLWTTDPWACKLGSHDEATVLTATSVYLRCRSCQKRTPGWNVTPADLQFLKANGNAKARPPVDGDHRVLPWHQRIA